MSGVQAAAMLAGYAGIYAGESGVGEDITPGAKGRWIQVRRQKREREKDGKERKRKGVRASVLFVGL